MSQLTEDETLNHRMYCGWVDALNARKAVFNDAWYLLGYDAFQEAGYITRFEDIEESKPVELRLVRRQIEGKWL